MKQSRIKTYQCPHCESELEELNYCVSVCNNEYGSMHAGYDGRAYFDCNDSGDGDWNGEPEYSCPECERELSNDEVNKFLSISHEQHNFVVGENVKIAVGKYEGKIGTVVEKRLAHHMVRIKNTAITAEFYYYWLKKIDPLEIITDNNKDFLSD